MKSNKRSANVLPEFNTVVEMLERNASLFPAEDALVELDLQSESSGRRKMTWKELDSYADRFANLLRSHDLKRGEKVAVLLVNSIEWLPVYLGILKSGCVAVPLSYRYTGEEIRYCLEKADCSAIVFGTEFVTRMEEIQNLIPNVRRKFYTGKEKLGFADNLVQAMENVSDESPQIPLRSENDAAIYFSSGTTGFPKAILHTHGSLVHAARTECVHHLQTHEDVFLCIPPLYHTGSKIFWLGSLLMGGRAVILKGTRPEWILKAISEEKCTVVFLLVPWAQDILDSLERGEVKLSDYELGQWRLMHIGAQPVPPSLIRRWHEAFPGQQYDTDYGLSESAGPGCVHLGMENLGKAGSIGKAGYGWKTKIVDEAGNEVKPGEVGELCVSGPCVMKCYYNDTAATSEVLRDGWLFTGDMMREDADGFLYYVDRKKDVIVMGGENIYPVQIENHIRRHESVKDVAVIAYPDSRLGEVPAAIIEIKPGHTLTEAEMNEYCLTLPRYKRPRKIIFATVPRNPTGKIEKTILRETYCRS